jgi:hypothetical protein
MALHALGVVWPLPLPPPLSPEFPPEDVLLEPEEVAGVPLDDEVDVPVPQPVQPALKMTKRPKKIARAACCEILFFNGLPSMDIIVGPRHSHTMTNGTSAENVDMYTRSTADATLG